jgi:hypothetical protein
MAERLQNLFGLGSAISVMNLSLVYQTLNFVNVGLKVTRRFGGARRLELQDRRQSQAINQNNAVVLTFLPKRLLNFHQATWRYILEHITVLNNKLPP